MWNGSNNSSGSGGGPPPGGPSGGPPPGWDGLNRNFGYLPGEREKDTNTTYDEICEIAERKTLAAVKNGDIKPEYKNEYYRNAIWNTLVIALDEVAAETKGQKVYQLENYQGIYRKTQGEIAKLKRNNP